MNSLDRFHRLVEQSAGIPAQIDDESVYAFSLRAASAVRSPGCVFIELA